MKQANFAFPNVRRKTPFQKHKEQEEDKKKRADAEAAKLYDEFVASFGEDEEEAKGPKSFVRGGTIQPGSAPDAAAAAAAGAGGRRTGKYVPKFLPPAMAAAFAEPDTKPAKRSGFDSDIAAAPVAAPTPSKGRGKPRNIDLMLAKLKEEQEERQRREQSRRERGIFDEPADDAGSLDEHDPSSTNLYVGNLAPGLDEEVLKKEFGRFGPIASVKVMWPRSDEERARGRNCGFVAFMRREDADRAKDELNGIILHDNELRIGWGKAVAIPAIPYFTASGLPSTTHPSKGVAIAPPGQELAPPWVAPTAASAAPLPHHAQDDEHAGVGPDLEIAAPADGRLRFIIDAVASYIVKDGCEFEQAVMQREAGNPEFGFLFDLACPEHAYYRWRVYSLAQGDSLRSWRVEPFVMLAGGPRWIPPAMTASDRSHQTAAQRGGELRDKDKPLSELQRDRFEELLRGISVERAAIRDAMEFCLDNAESAAEVVSILSEALTLAETPIPTKVARLFLVSDILHNSTAPVRNASRYRSQLEAALPQVFESMQEAYRGAESRMTQEALRRHVLRTLRVWRDWFIFADDFLNGLQATFLRSAGAPPVSNPGLEAELRALAPEDLDLRCRRNGVSKLGGRDAQVERLLALHAYLNGDAAAATEKRTASVDSQTAAANEALQTVLDSKQQLPVFPEPAAAAVQGPEPQPAAQAVKVEKVEKPVSAPTVATKWTLVDDDAEEQPAPERAQSSKSEDIFSDAGDTPVGGSGRPPDSPPASPAAAAAYTDFASAQAVPAEAKPAEAGGGAQLPDKDEEQRRKKLREVEVAVMVFKEDLEGDGVAKADIERRTAAHRAKLMAEAEESLRKEQKEREREARREQQARETERARERERDRERSDRDRKGESSKEAEPSSRSGRDKEASSSDRDKHKSGRERSRERDRDSERYRAERRSAERERERGRENGSRDTKKKRSRSSRSKSRSPKRSRSPERSAAKGKRHRDSSRSSRSRSPSSKKDRKRESSRRR